MPRIRLFVGEQIGSGLASTLVLFARKGGRYKDGWHVPADFGSHETARGLHGAIARGTSYVQ